MNDKEKASQLDKEDPLKNFKELFSLPKDYLYFCHNSLGLPTKSTSNMMQMHLTTWANLGVEGWFKSKHNWYTSINASLKPPLAHLLGAKESEVVVMNSLTVNLHLLMVSFYTPSKSRSKILMDSPTFPSDLYAIKSHLQTHGLDPETHLILAEDNLESILEKEGQNIALVFLSSVNFLTGHLLNMEKLTAIAKEQGCVVGYDIAHAAGNVPLYLHKWNVDFAIGCSYKYLCSGPGGPGIAYVHESHHKKELPRFSGWWGNDPTTRFQMHLEERFIPYGGASSWQVSTPSILSAIPLVESLKLYKEAGIEAIRKKSKLQTAFLEELLDKLPSHLFEIISPRDPESRGAQLSLLINNDAEKCLKRLETLGIICDFRPPNIIRVTPSALYSSFCDIYEFSTKFELSIQ